jgi:hypothetical protein
MFRFLLAILLINVAKGDCWKSIAVNSARSYVIKNEGKLQNPEDLLSTTDADLIIDGDSSHVIRSGYSFPQADTVVMELFETTVSYHNLFDIVIVKDQYQMRYSREINNTEFVQKFEPVKTKLELSSSDFSNGNKIRGHIKYTGRCVSGCSDKNKKIRIEGNFAVKINRY